MNVSRSGYYGWLNHIYLAKEDRDEEVMQMIKEIFIIGRSVYGSRRIKRELRQRGFSVSRRRTSSMNLI